MKLGLLTAAFPDLTLEQVAEWAAGEGFQALEIACWPAGGGERRRYAGVTHIDVEQFDPDAVRETMDRHGLTISSLAYYPNNLHPDDAHREEVNAHLRKVIDAAQTLGVGIVGTFVGNDKDRPLPENLGRFREIWPPLVDYAGERGVKVAIENCPMIFSYDEWPGGNNLAWSPAIWDEMFSAIPADNFGLNIDPSHLVWLMIDYERAVYDYADRIFHAHAKDLEVRRDGLYRHGTFSAITSGRFTTTPTGSSTRTRRTSRYGVTGCIGTGRSRAGSAGRSRGCPGSARCAGIASWRPSTRSATTTSFRSSMRTAASRATRTWSSAASCSRGTC